MFSPRAKALCKSGPGETSLRASRDDCNFPFPLTLLAGETQKCFLLGEWGDGDRKP